MECRPQPLFFFSPPAHLQFKLLLSLANSPIYQFNQCFLKCAAASVALISGCCGQDVAKLRTPPSKRQYADIFLYPLPTPHPSTPHSRASGHSCDGSAWLPQHDYRIIWTATFFFFYLLWTMRLIRRCRFSVDYCLLHQGALLNEMLTKRDSREFRILSLCPARCWGPWVSFKLASALLASCYCSDIRQTKSANTFW